MNSQVFRRATPKQEWRGGPARPGREIAGQWRRSIRATLAALVVLISAVTGGRAADATQPSRFLLIFETSPVLKKNLPSLRQTLGKLFAGNLQNEIQNNDDLAVWTVDQSLHTGSFPLASWSPEDAAMYVDRLNDFLRHQKFTRHAELAAVQPLLNRVARNSEHLTVLIFCDSQSRLLGTPYDSGVNEMITNLAARVKGGPIPLILVLRSYHGEYLGSSVNRWATLNFPKFPPPPPPAPPPPPTPAPVVTPAIVAAPTPVVRPMPPPVPALILVGTNSGTNVPVATKPASASAPPPAPAPPPTTSEPATNAVTKVISTGAARTNSPIPPIVAPAPAPAPVAKVVSLPPANPAPSPAPAPSVPTNVNVLATPIPAPQQTSAPEPVAAVAPPEKAISTNPPAGVESKLAGAVEESNASTMGWLWPWSLGGGALAAAGLGIWLAVRARRPRSSLITSTMQDDPRPPPGK